MRLIVTRKTFMVESKGIDKYCAHDYNDYVFITNNDWIVKVTMSDLRYCCIEENQKYVENIEYFNGIVKSCFNDEVGREFFMYLLTYDIYDCHPNDIPMTDFKRHLKSKNIDPIIKSIIDHIVMIIKSSNIDINDNLKLESLLSKEKDFFICDLYDTYLNLFNNDNKTKPTNNR